MFARLLPLILELPLQGAVGQATALAQEGDHLIQDRDKVHALLPDRCTADGYMRDSIIA